MAAAPGSTPPARRWDLWIGAALALFAAGLYARSLAAPFHFDDGVNILQNPHLRLQQLDLAGLWRAAREGANRRPLANLSFALNYRLHGYAPAGFHAVNLLVHAACSAAVFALARRLLALQAALPGQRGPRAPASAQRAIAALAAALFAAHPLQSQSVVYVVQRMNSLAALFYLLALLAWLAARRAPSPAARAARFGLAGGAWLLALGSKEIAITLPAAIWLVEWLYLRDLDPRFARASARRLLPPLLLAAGGLFYLYFQGPDWGYHKRDFGMLERGLTELRVLLFYASLALFPAPGRLSIHHAFPLSQGLLDPPTTLLAAAALLALAALALALARRLRWLAFGIAWFLLHHLLESSLLPLELVYEHRNYLPMFGLAFAGACALAWLAQALALPRGVALGAAGLLVLALAGATALRVEVWLDNETLWRDAAAKAPGEARPLHNLGVALAGKRRFGQAIALYERVLRLDPDHADARRNLGAARLHQGRPADALRALQEAERRAPDDAYTQAALGDALRLLGRPAEAEAHYRRALGRRADAQFYYGLGLVRAQQGHAEEALHWHQQALRVLPEFAPAEVARGALLLAQGRSREAIASFERVLASWDDPESHAHLASALWLERRHAEALAHAEAAFRAAPRAAIAGQQLAWMLATCPDPALRDPARALALLEPRLAGAESPEPGWLDTLAAARAAAGDAAGAARLAERAIALALARGDAALADELRARGERYAAGRGAGEGSLPLLRAAPDAR